MPVLASSRYAGSTVITVIAPDAFGGGDIPVIVPGVQKPYTFRYVTHQFSVGDRIDTLAYQYYSDATLWWRIADANPAILYWDDVATSTLIRIPMLS